MRGVVPRLRRKVLKLKYDFTFLCMTITVTVVQFRMILQLCRVMLQDNYSRLTKISSSIACSARFLLVKYCMSNYIGIHLLRF